jgi:hypothetical protein
VWQSGSDSSTDVMAIYKNLHRPALRFAIAYGDWCGDHGLICAAWVDVMQGKKRFPSYRSTV